MRVYAAAAILAVGLVAAPAATAKEFRPGDLRVCGRSQCVPIVGKRLLRSLSRLYYGPGPVHRTEPVRRGAVAFAFRWRDGWAAGLVAGIGLDRFRSHGVFYGRFQRGRWYRVPAEAAAALRKLTTGAKPLRVYPPPRSC